VALSVHLRDAGNKMCALDNFVQVGLCYNIFDSFLFLVFVYELA